MSVLYVRRYILAARGSNKHARRNHAGTTLVPVL